MNTDIPPNAGAGGSKPVEAETSPTRILISGAGRLTWELLKRVGLIWEPSIIDISKERLEEIASRFPQIHTVHLGDASSPVVLNEAGIDEYGYFLALTDSDAVNLASCSFAQGAGVRHILARVSDADRRPEFEEMGVRAVLTNSLASRAVVPVSGRSPLRPRGPGPRARPRCSRWRSARGNGWWGAPVPPLPRPTGGWWESCASPNCCFPCRAPPSKWATG